MHFHLAERIAQVKPSPTLAIAALAARMKSEGQNIISLSTGEPDFDTPQHIKDAAMAAIQNGFTKYTAVDGIIELKQAIQNKFKRENQLHYETNQITVSCGAKQAIYNLCQALLQAQDEVLIPAPYWVSYPDMVLLANAKPVIIASTSQSRYKITPEALEAAITPKTKLLFLNSPSNPSGMAYTYDELTALGEVLKKYPHILIASDDIYEHILWTQPFSNILNACPDLYPRTIIFNGVSKAYAMTGWRIGYAAGPKDIITAMTTIQSQCTSNPCSIAQKAAVAALNGGNEDIQKMAESFHMRHDFVHSQLEAIPGMSAIPADGTFYSFPNIKNILEKLNLPDDMVFSEKLLHQEGLAIIPGSAFGQPDCIRLSFACGMDTLKDAMARLARFCR